MMLGSSMCRACTNKGLDGMQTQTPAELNYEAHFSALRKEAQTIIRFLARLNKLIEEKSLDHEYFELRFPLDSTGVANMERLREMRKRGEGILEELGGIALPGAFRAFSSPPSSSGGGPPLTKKKGSQMQLGTHSHSLFGVLRNNLLNLARSAIRDRYTSYADMFNKYGDIRDNQVALGCSEHFCPFSVEELEEQVPGGKPNEKVKSADWLSDFASGPEIHEHIREYWFHYFELKIAGTKVQDLDTRRETVAAHLRGPLSSNAEEPAGPKVVSHHQPGPQGVQWRRRARP